MAKVSPEAQMVNLRVPQLLEELVVRLQETPGALRSAASVIGALQAMTHSDAAMAYFSSVVAEFDNFVTHLTSKGFRHDYCVFFAVPQIDGTVVELFPGGSSILVTPHNVDKFLALYLKYRESTPYRYTDHITHLPIAPSHHLASDFGPILELLDKEITKWQLDDKTWQSLDLTYAIPRNGVLVDLVERGRLTPVAHKDLPRYLELTRKYVTPTLVPLPPQPRSKPNYHDFDRYVKAIYFAGKVPSLRPLTEESFHKLDVRYCVPIMGKIVDLIPNGQNIRVPFAEKERFCELAAAKLGFKLETDRNQASPDVEADLAAADGLMSPRLYEFDMFAPSKKDVMANSLTKVLTNDEILFHFKTLLRQLATGQWSASDIRGLNLFYEIPVDGQLVPLVENGIKIPVTLENKDDFVVKALDALQGGAAAAPNAVVLPKMDQEENTVLALFSPSHFEADLFAPYVPSDQLPASELNADEQTFWAMLSALQQGFQPANLDGLNLKFALQLPNGGSVELKPNGNKIMVTQDNLDEFITAVQAKKEAIHLAFKYNQDMLDPIFQFPKERANLINETQLTINDLKSPIFTWVEGLSGSEFSAAEFEDMKLVYCIPLPEGGKVYNLIPDGRNILVTNKYRNDFVSRVLYERDRLQASVSEGPSLKQSTTSSVQKEMRKSITSIPLTDEQIAGLEFFRARVQQLGETMLDEAGWVDLGLAWVIRLSDVTFNIIPDGHAKTVSFAQRNEFISKCLIKCDEILADQAGRKSIVVPQAGAEEMGLFSPTHFTQDLFAPAQHITTKTNMGSSIAQVPTAAIVATTPQRNTTNIPNVATAMVPSPPAGPKPKSTESLQNFLQRNNIGAVHQTLVDNGVSTLAELIELRENDIREIVTAVLPRRRLLDAIATLQPSTA